MPKKFYLITNKAGVELGLVVAKSYDQAFDTFSDKSELGKDSQLWATIVDKDRVFDFLTRHMPNGSVIIDK